MLITPREAFNATFSMVFLQRLRNRSFGEQNNCLSSVPIWNSTRFYILKKLNFKTIPLSNFIKTVSHFCFVRKRDWRRNSLMFSPVTGVGK